MFNPAQLVFGGRLSLSILKCDDRGDDCGDDSDDGDAGDRHHHRRSRVPECVGVSPKCVGVLVKCVGVRTNLVGVLAKCAGVAFGGISMIVAESSGLLD